MGLDEFGPGAAGVFPEVGPTFGGMVGAGADEGDVGGEESVALWIGGDDEEWIGSVDDGRVLASDVPDD